MLQNLSIHLSHVGSDGHIMLLSLCPHLAQFLRHFLISSQTATTTVFLTETRKNSLNATCANYIIEERQHFLVSSSSSFSAFGFSCLVILLELLTTLHFRFTAPTGLPLRSKHRTRRHNPHVPGRRPPHCQPRPCTPA